MKIKILIALLALSGNALYAQIAEVKDGWIRTSVQGQKATGAFMKISAKHGAQLIAVSTPVAGLAELHEMKMEGDVMRMRALTEGLELPAGQTVELKPGGYHLMLMDLKTTLKKDSTVPLTLVFKDGKGQQSKLEITLPVSLGPLSKPGHQH